MDPALVASALAVTLPPTAAAIVAVVVVLIVIIAWKFLKLAFRIAVVVVAAVAIWYILNAAGIL